LGKNIIKKVVTITPNVIELDSRARRFDSIFKTLGYETCIISRSKKDVVHFQDRITVTSLAQVFVKLLKKYWRRYKKSNRRAIQHILAPFMFISYLIWVIAINLRKIKKLRADIIVLHESIDTISVLTAKFIFKAKIIVDVHDYYRFIVPENLQTPFDKFYRIKFEDQLRRILYKNANLLLTVSESLAYSLEKEYGLEFKTIKNIGNTFDSNNNLAQKDINLNVTSSSNIKRGVFIGNHKNALKCDWLKEAFWTNSSYRVEFTFIGDRYTDEFIKEFNSDYVHFSNSVDFFVDTFDFNLYDFGFLPYESTGLANEFALPNGFFLLAQSNLPLLVPKINEIARICEFYNLGLTSDFLNSECIMSEITLITSNEFLINKKLNHFNLDFNFKLESKKFLDMLSELNLIK
jgi:hypothetical protein